MSEVHDGVGPVLEAGDTAQAVIRAIRESNRSVDVRDRGAYLRVSVAGRCLLERAVVERILGRAFRLPGDLERIMPAFSGRFRVGDDQAVWEAGRR